MDESAEEKRGRKSRVSVLPVNPARSMTRSMSRCKSLANVSNLSRMRMRRQSFGFTGVAGIRPVERSSQLGLEFKRPPLIFLPTYQLEPKYKFNVEEVTKLVESKIDEEFASHKYNMLETPSLALRLAGELMREVKSLSFYRYRIISVVTIGQKRAQSFNNVIAFLWDHERDNYVAAHRETATAMIQVIIFAVYLD